MTSVDDNDIDDVNKVDDIIINPDHEIVGLNKNQLQLQLPPLSTYSTATEQVEQHKTIKKQKSLRQKSINKSETSINQQQQYQQHNVANNSSKDNNNETRTTKSLTTEKTSQQSNKKGARKKDLQE